MRWTRGDRNALMAEMQARQARILADLWASRAEGLPYETPEEALIMASIVEKETGVPRNAGRWPASSSTGCGKGCGCRPTRR
jgi:cell division protein YceG involved in septum cleavage